MKASGALMFILIFSPRLFAQLPPACANANPPVAKTCAQACILCNLDGYTSGTTQTTQGQILPGFCTQVVHSMSYMGFVAGSSNLTIQVTVGNCTLGNSIEMGIYQSDNCQEFNLVSDCNTAMFTGNTYTFTNTEPLNPGCPYFLVFDNNGPASCAFSVTVVDGSATAPTVAQAATPSGPDKVCPGATAVYTIPPLFGACEYRWTAPPGTLINGMSSPVILGHDEGTSVTVTWGNVGGQLCVRGSNPCSTGPFACLPVSVGPIPPTDLPPVSICFGETFDWLDGNTYNSSKLLTYTYVTSLGCDSVVRQQLTVRPPIITSLGVLRICAGECVNIGNNNYCNPGNFSETFTSYLGCDSTVFFSVAVTPVDANIAQPDTISCQQTAVLLDGSGSTPGVLYTWFDTSGHAISGNPVVQVGTPGAYTLVVTRTAPNIICRDTARVTVPSDIQRPDILARGDTLNCLHAQGQLSATSNTPGVTYMWSGADGFISAQPNPAVSQAGLYTLTVSAPNGCAAQDSVWVVSDFSLPVVTIAVPDTLTCALDTVLLRAGFSPSGTGLNWIGPQNFAANGDTAITSLPGIYHLIGVAPSGCADTFQVGVFADTLAPEISASGGIITCTQKTASLSANPLPLTSTLVWTGPQQFLSAQTDTSTLWPGMYSLLVTAPNGCTVSDTVLVMADTLAPHISISGDSLITCLQDTVGLSASLFPSGAGLMWSGPQNFSSADTSQLLSMPGLYYLTATSVNGCTTTATVEISADTLSPQVSAGGGTLTCTQPVLQLNAGVSPAGSSVYWTGPQGFTSAQINPAVQTAGIYTLLATGPNGCTATATALVTADASFPQVNANGGIITCAQSSVFLSASVLPPGALLLWSGPQGFSSGITNPEVSLPGLYTLLATTANGCTATASATVIMDTLAPVLNVSGGTITCGTPVVGLHAGLTPANTAILWSGPQNFSTTQFNPYITISGTYTAIASLPNGCTAQASVFVPADTVSPKLLITGGTLTCSVTMLHLITNIAPPGSAIFWSGPQSFTSSQPDPVVGVAGFYMATVTAANGCTASAGVQIAVDTVPPQISATGGNLTCLAPVIILQPDYSPPNAAVVWTGPKNFHSNLPGPAISDPGIYTAVVTGANGCTAETTVSVGLDTLPPILSASGGLLTCLQSQLMLSANVSPPGSIVSWTGPQNFSSEELSPVVSLPGIYTLLATSANGCTGTTQVQVVADNDFPQVSIEGGTLTCTQASLTLNATYSPPQSTLAWSGPQNFSSAQPDPFITIPGAYFLTVTTASGCSATASATVQIDTISPEITVTGGIITCSQTQTAITANILPAGSQINWAGPNNFKSGDLSPVIALPGLYLATATALNGCTATATALVQADTATPKVSAMGGTLSCSQKNIQVKATVEPPGATVLWSGPQQFSSSEFTPNVSLAGPYKVMATGPNGCTAEASVSVLADTSLPQIATSGGILSCATPQIQLTSTVLPQASLLMWKGPQNFSAVLPNPVVGVPGVYILTAVLPNGCSNTSTAIVSADTSKPVIFATGGDLTCLQDTVFLSAMVSPPNCSLHWSGPSGFSSAQPVPAAVLEGIYSLTATAPNGCSAEAQAIVTAHNQPGWTLSLGPDLYVEASELIFPEPLTDLHPAQMAAVQWVFPAGATGSSCDSCLRPWLKLSSSGSVSIEITDRFGCTLTDSLHITVQQSSAIYAPNIFTPEGQPGNQVFALFAGPEARVVRIRVLRIFDRWGNLAHERINASPAPDAHGWDGFARGKLAPAGVYVWYAEIEFENGRNKVLKGDVTLSR